MCALSCVSVYLRSCHWLAIPLSYCSNLAHLPVHWQWLWHTCKCFSLCVSIYQHINIYNLLFCTVKYSLLQCEVPQTLVHSFGVAAVRGVSRNKNIAEFQLLQMTGSQLRPLADVLKVVDGILAQLTPDERRKFRVGDTLADPSIELCTVGEWCIVMQCLCCQSSP